MKESYDDDEEEQEGPKSPFGVYFAEGDALYKQGEYRKAIESYSLALELQHNDKSCLIARSKCYLKLGDPQTALKDAEVALSEDSEFSRGLYQKAEALYSMGDFEYALMYYHRGHKLRPELDDFRLGIQKAQEAIDNSIGTAAKVKLENKGDLSFFQKQDDMSKKSKGYNKPAAMNKQKPMVSNRNKEVKTPAPSSKTVKQLLGELYEDKEYLEKLLKDTDFINSSKNKAVHDLVKDGLNYLDARTEFWRQQKPLYARKKGKHTPRDTKKKSGQQTATFIVKSLEDIDEALANGQAERSLKKAQSTLRSVEIINERDLPNKAEIVANLHSCMGNALLDMDKPQKALKHHEKDLDISKKNENDDGISRALDNIGRAYAKLAKYDKAIDNWSQKLPLTKTALESTWLNHEIGRCHLEIGDHEKAREFGEESLKAAKEAEDEVWQLNASVLIAQADVKLEDYPQAIISFNDALDLATALEDQAAKNAINKALGDIQKKMSDESAVDEKEEGQGEKQQSESFRPSENDSDQDREAEQKEGIVRDSLEDNDKDDHDNDLPNSDENTPYNTSKNENNTIDDNEENGNVNPDNSNNSRNEGNANNDNNSSSHNNDKEKLDGTE